MVGYIAQTGQIIIFALKNYSHSPSSIRNFEKLLEVFGGK
jgi:hypothetical protein